MVDLALVSLVLQPISLAKILAPSVSSTDVKVSSLSVSGPRERSSVVHTDEHQVVEETGYSPDTTANLASIAITPNQITVAPATTPAAAFCTADSATGGYRWQTFIASSNVDLAVLAFNASGPVSPGAGTFVAPLYSTAGSPQINKTTGTGTGALAGISTYNFATNVPVANGQYNIGYSCTLSGATERYWSTPITISSSTATTLSFSYGWVPGAITLSLSSYAATSCTIGISAPAASPAATGTTITYTPTGTILAGAVTVSGSPSSATSDVRTGLVQGQAYNVTATQTNVAGTSAASNTVSCTPRSEERRVGKECRSRWSPYH